MGFPNGFLWGGATAANQCEGGFAEGGFIYVDKTGDGSLERRPKKSFWWYKNVIASNGEYLE